MERRERERVDRHDTERVQRQRGGGHNPVREGGVAVRAGQRDGPADDDGRGGDARQRRRPPAGPAATAALPAEGLRRRLRRRRPRVAGRRRLPAVAVALHRLVQHQRRHHHHHRGREINSGRSIDLTGISIITFTRSLAGLHMWPTRPFRETSVSECTPLVVDRSRRQAGRNSGGLHGCITVWMLRRCTETTRIWG